MFAATHAMECNLRGVGGVVALNYDPGVLETELVTDAIAHPRIDPLLQGIFKATMELVRTALYRQLHALSMALQG
jgi:hypothetical protein